MRILTRSITLVFILFITINLNASSTKQDTFKKAIGIDANFVNNFLPFNNDIGARDNYLFHYMKELGNNKFIKHAFDIDVFGSFQDNELDVDRQDAQLDLAYKISKGRKKEVFKNGNIRYGTEFLIGYLLRQTANTDGADPTGQSVNSSLNQNIEVGVGPFLGFQYEISSRISVYTEMGFHLFVSYDVDTFSSDFSPELNATDTEIRFLDSINLPSSIILFYHF